jgi:hypothetical protein
VNENDFFRRYGEQALELKERCSGQDQSLARSTYEPSSVITTIRVPAVM